jgi:hypothetical protein
MKDEMLRPWGNLSEDVVQASLMIPFVLELSDDFDEDWNIANQLQAIKNGWAWR